MRIEQLRVRNFKAFKNMEMKKIPNLCVIVGANGAGKSTLFDVFGFLKDCLTDNVKSALQSRGGFNEVVSRNNMPQDLIEFEIKFRMMIANKSRLVSYIVKIGQDDNKKLAIKREVLRYKRGPYGSPYHFIDFKNGQGYAINNEEAFDKKDTELTREQQSISPDVLAIKGLGQFERFKAANAFRQLIENWHVSDFHINLARGSKDAVGYAEHLSVTGDNLQLVARNIYENSKDVFNKILVSMQQRVPGISQIEPLLTEDGRLLLKFKDDDFDDSFIDKYVSDGTIKMLAYLVLLYDPSPHPLLCVEEPENQLYPKLLEELAEEFRAYSKRGEQVFISTHSPDFLNAINIEEVFLLVKKNGYTLIKKAADDEQIRDYMNQGDKMGYLWKQGMFEGVDPK